MYIYIYAYRRTIIMHRARSLQFAQMRWAEGGCSFSEGLGRKRCMAGYAGWGDFLNMAYSGWRDMPASAEARAACYDGLGRLWTCQLCRGSYCALHINRRRFIADRDVEVCK